jgi:hypothetical protein
MGVDFASEGGEAAGGGGALVTATDFVSESLGGDMLEVAACVGGACDPAFAAFGDRTRAAFISNLGSKRASTNSSPHVCHQYVTLLNLVTDYLSMSNITNLGVVLVHLECQLVLFLLHQSARRKA